MEGTKVTYGTRMVDVATGEDLRIIKEFRAHHGCSAISPDGRLLAMGVSELYRAEGINNPGLLGGESVGLYDLKTGERLATMRGLAKQATMLAFSPDSRSLLVAEGSTGAIHEFKIEDPVRGQLHGHLRPFKDTIGPQVDYSPDGRLLATAGGRFVHVWDAKTLTGRRTIAATAESIIHVEFSPDSKRIATVGGRLGWGRDDKRLQIWDAETGEFLWGHASPGNHHWSVAYSPDGKRLATGHRTGSILVHDLDAGEIVARVQVRNVPDAMVRTIAFHPDGERLAAGNASGEIILFRIPEKTGANVPILEELARWKGHEKLVYRIAFNPDGSLLGTGDFHGTAVVWDTNTRKAIHRVVGNEIVFSPDGTRFVASGRGTTKDARPEAYGVRIHDTKTGAVLVTTRRGHYHPIISVDWSHDGKRLVTGGGDWVAAVWDAKTGEGDWSILPDDDE